MKSNLALFSVKQRSCNEDGLLLKPGKPITAIDQQIHASTFGSGGPIGEVWTTFSQISKYTFGIILAADIKNTYFMTSENVGFDVAVNRTLTHRY